MVERVNGVSGIVDAELNSIGGRLRVLAAVLVWWERLPFIASVSPILWVYCSLFHREIGIVRIRGSIITGMTLGNDLAFC